MKIRRQGRQLKMRFVSRRQFLGMIPATAAAVGLVACTGTRVPSSAPISSSAPVSKPASASTAPAALSAGASAASASGPPASSSGPLAKVKMMTGGATPSQTAIWAAMDGGFFERNGLAIDNSSGTAGAATTAAITSGEAQFANAGGAEVASAIAAGSDLVVIGMLEPIYDLLLEVPEKIKTAADLKGKLLGIPTKGGAYDVATRVAVRKLGLDPKEVQITALGSVSAATAGVLNGTVAGGVVTLTDSLLLEAKGFHPLLNMGTSKLPCAQSAMYLQRSYMDSHREIVQKYTDSVVQATRRVKQDKAFTLGLWRKYLKLDDDRVLNATYDFYTTSILPSLPFPAVEQFTDAIEVLAEVNPKIQGLDMKKNIDASFVQNAADRGLDRA